MILNFPLNGIETPLSLRRSEFQVLYPGGDYVRFEGTLPSEVTVKEDGTADVGIGDIEILERGNILIGNAADELPQVSL